MNVIYLIRDLFELSIILLFIVLMLSTKQQYLYLSIYNIFNINSIYFIIISLISIQSKWTGAVRSV